MSKLETFFEYLKTIALSILAMIIAMVIFLVIVQHNVYNDAAQKDAEDDTIEYYLIGILIEKNKYLERQYPKNYKINLKLGILYEINKDYTDSEAEYKIAISKAPYDQYKPVYKLAILYIKQNKLDKAQKLIDDIDDKPDKNLIADKAEIYFGIGEKYYNIGDYLTAIDKYQKSLFYYERIHSYKTEDVKHSLASAYVYLAEGDVKELKIEEAISSLLTANSLVDAPIIKYKLALLLIKDDPDAAYKYFEEVLKKEPGIVNFDVYYNFLMSLSKAADDAGNIAESELYSYKAKKFKEFFQKNILSVGDIRIEMAEGKMTTGRWSKKRNLNLKFQLKNTAANNLNSLFIHVTFKDGSETITEYSDQIIDENSPIKAGSIGPTININAVEKRTEIDKIPKPLTAELYVSKTENSYKIYLITVPIKEIKKVKKAVKKTRIIDNF